MPIVVEAVCISTPASRVAKTPLPEVYVTPVGLGGDRHAGERRLSTRTQQYIPNNRQWSAVATEEVEAFCRALEVAPFAIGALGENLRLSGLLLAEVTPGTVLEFPSGCRLRVSAQNHPCENAAEELAVTYGPNVGRDFVKASYGKRGVVGAVLAPGMIRPGDEVRLSAPVPAEAASASA